MTASTPIHKGTTTKHKGVIFNINEIIHHPGAFTVPATDIIAAPGQQGQAQLNRYLTRAWRRLQNMAQPAPPHLQGTDPALIAILNRMENKDSTCKKFIMFPKADFDGSSKQAAKSHWLNFQKYVAYQHSQNLLDPDDPNKFPEVKRMFRLTLSNNVLGWYDTEEANWTTFDQVKQAFLKRFNIWGDTRRQQQDSWNKLHFDMAKDDIDSFVTDMKTLASILGHNDDVVMEKFKDVFPDKNIEAALIGMNNFNDMQPKAKQLVQIYRPNYTNDSNSLGACLMHTHEGDTPSAKPKVAKSKVSNQHQLAPTQNTRPSKPGNPQGGLGEVIKITTIQDPNKVKIMMVITVKIILGIAPGRLVVQVHKAEVANHGSIIIQMIKAKILKGTALKEEGVVIKIEAGDMVTTHNKGNNKHIPKITSHLKAHILIWLHRLCPHKI